MKIEEKLLRFLQDTIQYAGSFHPRLVAIWHILLWNVQSFQLHNHGSLPPSFPFWVGQRWTWTLWGGFTEVRNKAGLEVGNVKPNPLSSTWTSSLKAPNPCCLLSKAGIKISISSVVVIIKNERKNKCKANVKYDHGRKQGNVFLSLPGWPQRTHVINSKGIPPSWAPEGHEVPIRAQWHLKMSRYVYIPSQDGASIHRAGTRSDQCPEHHHQLALPSRVYCVVHFLSEALSHLMERVKYPAFCLIIRRNLKPKLKPVKERHSTTKNWEYLLIFFF